MSLMVVIVVLLLVEAFSFPFSPSLNASLDPLLRLSDILNLGSAFGGTQTYFFLSRLTTGMTFPRVASGSTQSVCNVLEGP